MKSCPNPGGPPEAADSRATTVDDGQGGPSPHHPLTIGKYLVSPLVDVLENGWFAGSVSIRSGSGPGTTDRVLRLARRFRCAKEAAACAHVEGRRWIADAHRPRLAAPH